VRRSELFGHWLSRRRASRVLTGRHGARQGARLRPAEHCVSLRTSYQCSMANKRTAAFLAFPAAPPLIADPIQRAVQLYRGKTYSVTPWPQMKITGLYIPDEVRAAIDDAAVIFADVSQPNANVYYEIGYAVGLGKGFVPLVNAAHRMAKTDIRRQGIFDNIGYKQYENSKELANLLDSVPSNRLLDLYGRDVNVSQPLFLLDTLRKTDFRNAIVSAIKDGRAFYRSFDPVENARISLVQLISEISSSAAVVIPYLGTTVDDHDRHNLRAALVAGLAHGLRREVLLIRHLYEDVERAADYHDMIVPVRSEAEIFDLVKPFAQRAALSAPAVPPRRATPSKSSLQSISLGSSAAENEFRDLGRYFVETSEFIRARRGEASIVTGRKGSGKTAIFFQVRDNFRNVRDTIVTDLKPESHQLSLFRSELLKVGDEGIFDHTIAAFWYFVVLSEVLLTIHRSLDYRSKMDSRALSRVNDIRQAFEEFGVLERGDFTTRLSRLGKSITQDIQAMKKRGQVPSPEMLTNLVFKNGIARVKELIIQNSTPHTKLVFLFDNVDKGWPHSGVHEFDVRLVRLLLESLGKVRRDFASADRDFQSAVFLRNDIYELLVEQTPDRGKAGRVGIDWTDRAKLRQVIYRRLQQSLGDTISPFESLWSRFFPSSVDGQESFDYFLDHSLMRPRFLISVVELAIANAVNRGHPNLTEEDCRDAVRQNSLALLDDFGFEIRDVSGLSENLLYGLIGINNRADGTELIRRIEGEGLKPEEAENALDLMLWYGLLGIIDREDRPRYIYDYDYNARRLEAERRQSPMPDFYAINPALHVALSA
jgi:hypothetical protein